MLLDEIYVVMGEIGLYQVTLYVLLMLVSIPTGWSHVGITFIGADMPHWCMTSELTNLSYDLQKNISIPMVEKDGKMSYSKCEVFNLNYSQYTMDDFLNWDRAAFNDTPTRKCSAWVYDRSTFDNTILSQFDLVCDDTYLLAMAQTIYMSGVLVGCFMFGQISDRIGRLNTVVISSCLWVLSAFIAAFVPNYIAFTLFRFIVGACAAGAFTTVFVMSMEMIGPSYRMELGVFVQGWFALGVMTLSGMSYMVRDSFYLQLIMASAPVLFLSYYWLLQESPRWLIVHGRDKEAELILRKMARVNGNSLPDDLDLQENRKKCLDDEDAKKAMFVDLFRTKNLRLTTIFMWIAWMSTSIVYFGLSLGVALLEGSLFFNNFLTGIVEIPSYFLSIIALKYVGRRWPTIITFLMAGIFCLLHMPFIGKEGMGDVVITLMMLGKGFGAASFAILYVFAAELFPTCLRNVGVGTSSMVARVGGLVQPQFALLSNWWYPAPFMMYGLFSVLGAAVSLYFPETLNRKLPETVEDAENFRNSRNDVLIEDASQNLAFVVSQPDNLAKGNGPTQNGQPDTFTSLNGPTQNGYTVM